MSIFANTVKRKKMIKYINLTNGFNPFRFTDGKEITFESFKFSGGEPHIRVDNFWNTSELFNLGDRQLPLETTVILSIRLNKGDDLLLLAMAVDALRNMGVRYIYAFIPYFPGARQDRVMVGGEPMSAGVYARIINSLKLDRVFIYDVHSDVTPAVIDNCVPIDNHDLISTLESIDTFKKYNGKKFIVSPDSGARKKIQKLFANANHFFDDILYCDKIRDPRTGELTGFTVPHDVDVKDSTCVIVDDICDGGGTFLGLGEELRRRDVESLHLVVSHGIFSKGFSELDDMFDSIHTTNSIRDWDVDTIKYYTGRKPNLDCWEIGAFISWSYLYHSPNYSVHSIDV